MGEKLTMEFLDALKDSLKELGIDDLDDNSDDIPAETAENAQDASLEDEANDLELDDDYSDDEQDDEPEHSGPVLEIVEDADLKLPDGTVISAKEALLRQSDYTRKTQELAQQRKAFEQERAEYLESLDSVEQQFQQVSAWYEERASRPSDWIAEIASTSSDPTSTIAKALYDLAQTGVLERQFVDMFGIDTDAVREKAEKHEINSELEEIKAWRRQQEEENNRQALVQQQIQRYEGEWNSIKRERQLAFESPAEELQVKNSLLRFALENNMTRSLTDAYDLMTVRSPIAGKKLQSSAKSDAKKRASRAVTPKSAVASKREKQILTDRDAILATLEENGI